MKSVNKDKLLCLYSFETKGDVQILAPPKVGISLLAIYTAADMPALQGCSHDSYLMIWIAAKPKLLAMTKAFLTPRWFLKKHI